MESVFKREQSISSNNEFSPLAGKKLLYITFAQTQSVREVMSSANSTRIRDSTFLVPKSLVLSRCSLGTISAQAVLKSLSLPFKFDRAIVRRRN